MLLNRAEAESYLNGQPVGSAVLRRKSPSVFVVSFVTDASIIQHTGFEQVGTQFVTPSGKSFDSVQVGRGVRIRTIGMVSIATRSSNSIIVFCTTPTRRHYSLQWLMCYREGYSLMTKRG
jgi:hypothetical protein